VLHGKTTARGTFNVAHHAIGNDLGAYPTDTPGEIAHYPATEGVSSTQILTLMQGVRDALADVPEALSAAMRVSEGLPDRRSALAAMHFPHTAEDRETGRERLAIEELLLTQLVFLRVCAVRAAVAERALA
jgi:RecG-like helicase